MVSLISSEPSSMRPAMPLQGFSAGSSPRRSKTCSRRSMWPSVKARCSSKADWSSGELAALISLGKALVICFSALIRSLSSSTNRSLRESIDIYTSLQRVAHSAAKRRVTPPRLPAKVGLLHPACQEEWHSSCLIRRREERCAHQEASQPFAGRPVRAALGDQRLARAFRRRGHQLGRDQLGLRDRRRRN